jgi:hypothetical protein
VAGDLRRFDGAAADLLPPGDYWRTGTDGTEVWKIAVRGLGSLVERVRARRNPRAAFQARASCWKILRLQ